MKGRGVVVRSTCALVMLLIVPVICIVGCTTQEEEPIPTLTPTPTLYTPASTATPSPTPATISKTLNITRELSSLSITLTAVSWTGDEMLAEWVIKNQTNKAFEADRLYSIFTPGALAKDQTGREGEYFIPEFFIRHLEPGGIKHYETKWVFYPESEEITIRLSDIYVLNGHNFIYTSAEYKIYR